MSGKRQVGWPSLSLLSLGHARESNSGREAVRNAVALSPEGDTSEMDGQRRWTPASAGVTSNGVGSTTVSVQVQATPVGQPPHSPSRTASAVHDKHLHASGKRNRTSSPPPSA